MRRKSLAGRSEVPRVFRVVCRSVGSTLGYLLTRIKIYSLNYIRFVLYDVDYAVGSERLLCESCSSTVLVMDCTMYIDV